jgi:hypothetical protein
MQTDGKRGNKGVNWNAVGIVTTILLAFIGYTVTYINTIRIDRERAEVELLNNQLEHLYGPLYSLNQTGKEVWKVFRKRYRPQEGFFSSENPPNEEEKKAWVLWMREVFMPNNLKMEKVIVENAHLVVGSEMPKSFIDFIAHVEGYKVVLKKWKEGDFSEYTSSISFPPDITLEIEQTFKMLKAKQAKLLGHEYVQEMERGHAQRLIDERDQGRELSQDR